MPDLFRAIRAIDATLTTGEQIHIAEGEHIVPDHEAVRAWPELFAPVDRHERIRAAYDRNPAAGEAGATFGRDRRQADSGDPIRSAALRTIEQHAGELRSDAADRLDHHLRENDPLNLDARYLAAVGSDDYLTAFGKILQYGGMASLRMTPAEQTAVQDVTAAEQLRAMSTTGTSGGFAVPFTLDPSIMNTSNGAISPLRQVARTVTISGSTEWRGVSSAGVTSNYGAEASEVGDDAPTLAQPTIRAQRWTSFVPFSIEIGQDWTSLQQELATLMRDAKDVLDATKFLLGSGSNEPGGILNIGGTGGLTTSQRVQTAGTAAYAIADVYALKNALPARFQPNASYLAAGATIDSTYRFVGGNSAEPSLVNPERTAILGKPLYELSTVVTTTTSASKIMLYGDWQQAFVIVDRLGVQLELVPHLFGASQRPTGQRGLLAIGRTGSGVVNASAARYLEVR